MTLYYYKTLYNSYIDQMYGTPYKTEVDENSQAEIIL